MYGYREYNQGFDLAKRVIRRRTFWRWFKVIVILGIVMYAMYYLIPNPTEVGEFFGKIIQGFKSAAGE